MKQRPTGRVQMSAKFIALSVNVNLYDVFDIFSTTLLIGDTVNEEKCDK